MKSIYAASSISKKPVNQDFTLAQILENGSRLLLVADGIGSHYKAEFGAKSACEFLWEKAKENPSNINFESLFLAIPGHIKELVEEAHLLDGRDPNRAFGTTLLCGLETEREYKIAYVGNGAILHIRGNFNHFPKTSPQYQLPWTLSNLLNPHSMWENGNNVLYKFVSPYAPDEITRPTLLSLIKDEDQFGEILIFCTDGLYSADQIMLGRADDDKIWIGIDEKVIILLEYIRDFLNREHYTSQGLTEIIEFYLQILKERQLIEDDCSLAIIISEKTIEYHSTLQKNLSDVTHS